MEQVPSPIPTQKSSPQLEWSSPPSPHPTPHAAARVPYTTRQPEVTPDMHQCIEKWKSVIPSYGNVRPERVFVTFTEDASQGEMKAILQSYGFNVGALFSAPERPVVWLITYKPGITDDNGGYEIRRQISEEIERRDNEHYGILESISMEQPFLAGGSAHIRLQFNEHATESMAQALIVSIDGLKVVEKLRPSAITTHMVQVPQGSEIEWACILEREAKILSAQPEIPTPPPSR